MGRELFLGTFGWLSLLEVDDRAPAKIVVQVLDLHKPPRLQERQAVVRVADHGLHVLRETGELLSQIIILPDRSFIRNVHVGSFGLQFM